MISGTLPNNTVWWISKDGKKVWIESVELEKQKFSEKGYSVAKDIIYSSKIRKQVGELAGSRLERRLHNDAWIISLNVFLDIYPDLLSEIEKKTMEAAKAAKEQKNKAQTRTKKKPKISKISSDEVGKEKEEKENNNVNEKLTKESEEKQDEIKKSYFDITHQYVKWIIEEIEKSPDKEIKILSENMKEKMGKEYINMHDLRIYLGLKKILTEIGIVVELGQSKGKSILTIKKIP